MRAALLAPATPPPAGLPGLDPAWSRIVTTDDAGGERRGWHVLDTGVPDGGSAPAGTLLCVHGNPTWSYLWRRLLAHAPAGWRVVAVDQLEMGYSERTGTRRRLHHRIDDLGRLTDALELHGPVVTVAHDWGGPISLGWARDHREQVAGLVLTNTAVHQPASAPAPALIRLARTPGLLEVGCVRTPAFLRSALAMARPSLSDDVRSAYLAPYLDADRRRGIGDFVRDIPLDPTHPSAGSLEALAADVSSLPDVPALLVWGPRDPVFSDRYLHDLEDRLPRATVHRGPDAGHLAPEDLDLASIVAAWLGAARQDERAAEAPVSPAPPRADRAPLWARLEDPAHRASPAIVEMPPRADGPRRRDGQEATPRTVSFGDLAARVRDLAAGLADHGVAPGDRVALLVPPGIELATAIYACWRLGAVAVLADAGLGVRGITGALRSAAPDHLVGIPRALLAARALAWPGRRIATASAGPRIRWLTGADPSLAELQARGRGLPTPPPPGPDAEAVVAFTSGATGPAKGVVYRHRQLQAQRDALMATYGIRPDDRLVAAFAPFALYGPGMGITSVVPDMDVTSPRTLRARALADAVRAIGATLVFASPAALANVVADAATLDDQGRDALTGVRLLMSAGAPVPPDLLRAAGALVPHAEPHTPYGMTEVLPVADISLAAIEAAGAGQGVCVGPPVVGVEVAIAALDGAGRAGTTPSDEPDVTGEIWIRAEHIMDRYDRLWAVQHHGRVAGWHRSGDVGHLDADGRLWVEGRAVHVITTAGGPVTPVGVERAVEAIDHVRLAAAIGVGPRGTQQVVVVVATDPAAPRGDLAPSTLTAAVRRTVDVPVAAVLVAPELPVDIRHNSKIDRTRLARWAERVLAGDRVGTP